MMKQTIAKEKPLAEITLRRYEKPYQMSERELIRKLCLSLGLLQTGDSRDIIVDIFHVLLQANKQKKALTPDIIQQNIITNRTTANLPLKGIAPSNVRRQLKRLKDLFLIEKINDSYRITEHENIRTLYEEKIKKYYLPSILSRIEEYLQALEQ
ncbi:MAG: hypothetical protein Q7R56_01250 [Nanoarchaeota archaeon]|nr:hypothetical protein [Nanoarchaeota archaeon]